MYRDNQTGGAAAPATLFRPAADLKSWLRLAFVGVSGSGKTYSSLALARELAGADGKIAVVDTEHGTSAKYSDIFTFDVLTLDNYHPQHYIDAINAAASSGYRVIILDSLSHAWSGHGGLLELVDNIAARSKNSFAAWKDATPIHRQMIETIIGTPIHVIATMRAKTEYIIEENEKGKKIPRKVGLAPEQRAGLEYEFDVVGDLEIDGKLIISKTRCAAINEKVYPRPNAEFYAAVTAWANRGHGNPAATPEQFDYYETLRANYAAAGLGELKPPVATATAAQMDRAIAHVQKMLARHQEPAAPEASVETSPPAPPAPGVATVEEIKTLSRQLWEKDWQGKLEVFAGQAPRTLNATQAAELLNRLRHMATHKSEKAAAEIDPWDDDPSDAPQGTNNAPDKPEKPESEQTEPAEPALTVAAPSTAARPEAPGAAPAPSEPAAAPAATADQQPEPPHPPQTPQGGGQTKGAPGMTSRQRSMIFVIADKLWGTVAAIRGVHVVLDEMALPRMSDLTSAQASKVIERLTAVEKGLLPLPEVETPHDRANAATAPEAPSDAGEDIDMEDDPFAE